MTAMFKPTDSVLRRHFESNFEADELPTSPQDSTLIRHHEQMRAAARIRAERAAPEPLSNSSASSVGQHPLAIHLEMRRDKPRSVAIRPASTARSSHPRTTGNPPEDSTLARHYAQSNDVSFAEHPLATHLRIQARTRQAAGGQSPSEATSAMEDRASSMERDTSATTESRADDPSSSATVEEGHNRQPVQTEPNKHGWLWRLLRSITGRQ